MVPIKIPNPVIPELVEWLLSDRDYPPEIGGHKYSVLTGLWIAGGYAGAQDNYEKDLLTAALEAFNQRETKMNRHVYCECERHCERYADGSWRCMVCRRQVDEPEVFWQLDDSGNLIITRQRETK